MRTLAPPLVTVVAIVVVGCASQADHGNRSPESTSPTPAATVPAQPGPAPASDPDMPRDLVGPPMTLTGTVHVANGCVVLDVNGRRWALFGQTARTLTDGRTATVRGRPMRLPAGCDADHALAVRSVT